MQLTDIVALRRAVHAHAEPGLLEFHTASLIMDQLDEAGVSYLSGAEAMKVEAMLEPPTEEEYAEWSQRATEAGVSPERVKYLREHGTAIIAVVRGNRPGPVWGLRCDIDALPIKESSSENHVPFREGFRSKTPYMHACGHDGHTAIGIALATRLSDGDFPGELRILFQPAEEGVRGAIPMMAANVTEGIDRMLAVHLRGQEELGMIHNGLGTHKATTKWRAKFIGEPAHAAGAPEKGRHAIAAAAQATLGILGFPRYATTDTRVNVGTFHASGSASIIPAEATITYEVRCEDNSVLEDMDRRAEDVMQGAAKMHGVAVTTNVYGRSINAKPTPELMDLVEKQLENTAGVTGHVREPQTRGGSDDANFFIDAVQGAGGMGAYIAVGAKNSGAPHHNHSMDVDEKALGIATDLLEKVFRAG